MGQWFPRVHIDRDAIFVQQAAVKTAPGLTAGLKLALAPLKTGCGHDVKMEVARELVLS